MFRFSIRDLLWLTLVVALGLGWFVRERIWLGREQQLQEQLAAVRKEQYLQSMSPAQRKFYSLCISVKKGMTEQEVDAILAGYPQKRSIPSDEGLYTKSYDEKPGANEEGDRVFVVTFDEEHRAVHVGFGGYVK